MVKNFVVSMTCFALIYGCSTPPALTEVSDNSSAYVFAAGENFFVSLSSNKATTRIDALNGVETGASRFNRGAGIVPAGEVKLLLRFWGENKQMGFPIGSPPPGRIETFACVTFQAIAKKRYEVSSEVARNAYVVFINDVTEATVKTAYRIDIPFNSTATAKSCNI